MICCLQVKILRPESYWYNQTGKVVSVDQVRFSRVASCAGRAAWPQWSQLPVESHADASARNSEQR
jgi:hypothetical protein